MEAMEEIEASREKRREIERRGERLEERERAAREKGKRKEELGWDEPPESLSALMVAGVHSREEGTKGKGQLVSLLNSLATVANQIPFSFFFFLISEMAFSILPSFKGLKSPFCPLKNRFLHFTG